MHKDLPFYKALLIQLDYHDANLCVFAFLHY